MKFDMDFDLLRMFGFLLSIPLVQYIFWNEGLLADIVPNSPRATVAIAFYGAYGAVWAIAELIGYVHKGPTDVD